MPKKIQAALNPGKPVNPLRPTSRFSGKQFIEVARQCAPAHTIFN
jgi:hypothetical protein